jgi:hypothetical protein
MGLALAAAIALAVGLGQPRLPKEAVAEQRLGPRECTKKRVDPCGCHHVYGIRHCHPNRVSGHCESGA